MHTIYKVINLVSLVFLFNACNFSIPEIDCSQTNICSTSGTGTTSSTSTNGYISVGRSNQPSAVENIKTTSSLGLITLSWDNGTNTDTYTIKRRVDNEDYTLITDFATSPYTDSNLKDGTNYYYAITAINIYGNTQSKDFLVRTPSPLLSKVSDKQITLSWTEIPGFTYSLSRGTNPDSYDTVLASNIHSPYTDSNLINDTSYYYQLNATDTERFNVSSVLANASPMKLTTISYISATETSTSTSTDSIISTDTNIDTGTGTGTGTDTDTILAWQNSIQLGSINKPTYSNAIATDLAGNVYITGTTAGGLDGHQLQGLTDIYITKYNSSGIKQWTSQIGSENNNADAFGLAINNLGSIYIVGSTTQSLYNNTQHGFRDAFVAKFDTNDGSIQWSQQLGAFFGTTAGFGISLDGEENIYISGYTNRSFLNAHQHGFWDIFISKFNKYGAVQWNKQFGTRYGTSASFSLKTDQTGNILVSGYTNGGIENNSQHGFWDIFIAKISSSGNLIWTKQLGASEGSSVAIAVDSDASGNAYVTGYTNIGLGTNIQKGNWDLFLAKFNSSGLIQWIQQAGSPGGDTEGLGLTVTKETSPKIYITGLTDRGLNQNTKQGNYDAFVQAYNSSGIEQWTQELGVSGATTEGFGIARDESGNIYITGYTSSALGSATQTGVFDAFITKYDSFGLLQ